MEQDKYTMDVKFISATTQNLLVKIIFEQQNQKNFGNFFSETNLEKK